MRTAPWILLITLVSWNDARAQERVFSSAGATPDSPVYQTQSGTPLMSPSGLATLDRLALGENAFLAFLQMKPGAAVPEHQDPTEEYIVILEGGGTLTLNGTAHTLGPGSVVYMHPNAKVSYQNGKKATRAIQVFAGPAPARKYQAWAPSR